MDAFADSSETMERMIYKSYFLCLTVFNQACATKTKRKKMTEQGRRRFAVFVSSTFSYC